MSFSLIFLSALILAVAFVPLVVPRLLFEYPLILGMFLALWLLPQAWLVEKKGLAGPFDPTQTWIYMTLSVIFLCAGYVLGRKLARQKAVRQLSSVAVQYNDRRMMHASLGLIVIGGVALVVMQRTAEANTYANGWTGIINLYALLSMCLLIGAALTFLLFLRTKSRAALILFLVSSAAYLPILLVSVRREFIFGFGVIVFGGLFLVRKTAPPRALLIFGCVVGSFIVNNAGSIRAYVARNDATLIGALTSAEVREGTFDTRGENRAAEVTGAVTDIAIASDIGEYHPFVSLYNGMVARYFPSFIFGREAKNAAAINVAEENPLSNRFHAGGATRTGFSDTFIDYWYFGVLAFAGVGFYLGWLYTLAYTGILRYQLLYVLLLGGGLHAITHSVQEFVCSLPFTLAVTWMTFRYVRLSPKESAALVQAQQLQTAP